MFDIDVTNNKTIKKKKMRNFINLTGEYDNNKIFTICSNKINSLLKLTQMKKKIKLNNNQTIIHF